MPQQSIALFSYKISFHNFSVCRLLQRVCNPGVLSLACSLLSQFHQTVPRVNAALRFSCILRCQSKILVVEMRSDTRHQKSLSRM